MEKSRSGINIPDPQHCEKVLKHSDLWMACWCSFSDSYRRHTVQVFRDLKWAVCLFLALQFLSGLSHRACHAYQIPTVPYGSSLVAVFIGVLVCLVLMFVFPGLKRLSHEWIGSFLSWVFKFGRDFWFYIQDQLPFLTTITNHRWGIIDQR
jgi:hypothetical protein